MWEFEQVGEVEFDGEHAALSVVAETITQAKVKLEAARETLRTARGTYDIDKSCEDGLAAIREIHKKAVEMES